MRFFTFDLRILNYLTIYVNIFYFKSSSKNSYNSDSGHKNTCQMLWLLNSCTSNSNNISHLSRFVIWMNIFGNYISMSLATWSLYHDFFLKAFYFSFVCYAYTYIYLHWVGPVIRLFKYKDIIICSCTSFFFFS